MKHNYMILCQHCLSGIVSRGENINTIDYLRFVQEYENLENVNCEWCKEQHETSQLVQCEL